MVQPWKKRGGWRAHSVTKRKKLFMFSLVPAHFVRPHEPLSWFYLGFIQKLIQKPNVKLWSKGGNSAHWQDIASSESMVFPASSFFVPPPFTVDPCGWLDQSNQCYFYLVNPMKPRIVDRHCHHPLRMGHWETVCCFLGQSPHDPVSCFPWRYTAHPQSIHESPSNKYHVARYGFVMVCPILRWPVSPEGLFNHQTQAVATPQSRSSPQIAHSSMPCPPNAPVAPKSGNRNWRWISGDPRESNIAKLICGYHMRMVNFQVLPGLVDYHCLGTIL